MLMPESPFTLIRGLRSSDDEGVRDVKGLAAGAAAVGAREQGTIRFPRLTESTASAGGLIMNAAAISSLARQAAREGSVRAEHTRGAEDQEGEREKQMRRHARVSDLSACQQDSIIRILGHMSAAESRRRRRRCLAILCQTA